MPPSPIDGDATGPDLSSYRHMHYALRIASNRLIDALCSSTIPDRTRASSLARWFAGYSGELRTHHRTEDEIFFPALARVVEEYTEHSQCLESGHHHLDNLLAAMRDAMARLADDSATRVRAHAEAGALATRLHDLLVEHLDLEDRHVLPLFEQHFARQDYADLDAQAFKQVRVRQALFTVPWLLATISPADAERMLGHAPLPLKVIYRLTRRSYARLERAASGSAK